MRSIILALILPILLAGCITNPLKREVETKYVVVRPNPSELADCDKIAPPEREAFLKMTQEERIAELGTYARRLQGAQGKCDNHAALRKFFDEQEKIYSKSK